MWPLTGAMSAATPYTACSNIGSRVLLLAGQHGLGCTMQHALSPLTTAHAFCELLAAMCKQYLTCSKTHIIVRSCHCDRSLSVLRVCGRRMTPSPTSKAASISSPATSSDRVGFVNQPSHSSFPPAVCFLTPMPQEGHDTASKHLDTSGSKALPGST